MQTFDSIHFEYTILTVIWTDFWNVLVQQVRNDVAWRLGSPRKASFCHAKIDLLKKKTTEKKINI